MCTTCGCGPNDHDHGPHHHHHDHHHHHETEAPADAESGKRIAVETDILAKNDRFARGNRALFAAKGIFALNLVSSPGSGKTTILERTLRDLGGTYACAVIEGDQQTDNDAVRIAATGVPVKQINTGAGCHLDAHMVGHALEAFDLERLELLLIENVGNLVCPAAFDLGEDHKVVVLSVTEGEDKPLKYPQMFHAADVMLLNKTDLLPHLDFDLERCKELARRVSPGITIFEVSSRSGAGMDGWYGWLAERVRARQGVAPGLVQPFPETMTSIERISVEIEGIVQGVGFRPFVYRLALIHGLSGWVRNTPRGVLLEAEGERAGLDAFYAALTSEAPPLAVIGAIARTPIPVAGEAGFRILASATGSGGVEIAPDGDVCPDCLAELFDPTDRRHCYPFINCTNCGPRYSIITATPYDRAATTMAPFAMCAACRAEYEDPASRRFHAQPNACPVCGPRLELRAATGEAVAEEPLAASVALLRAGRIVAVKGMGGYQLAVDATNEAAVAELRRRKQRDEKPFALMVPDLATAASLVRLSPTEERLLAGPERPIVILPKQDGHGIAPLVAPGSGYFGVMLPSTPMHHLLLQGNFRALVMTSGNLSDEPIAYRDDEAAARLAGIADCFLCHDREIRTRSDDSVIRVFRGEPLFIRRARGYVPRSVTLPAAQPMVLAVGAELKSTVCLTRGDRAYLSQHLGDLKNAATLASLAETVEHLQRLLEVVPVAVAHDLHPDYLSTAYARERGDLPLVAVQHHHAHLAACMAENGLEGEVLGVIFDGAGYGPDGTVWGGEFLVGDYRGFARRGHFARVPLPGGDAAAREPWRMALSHCHAALRDEAFQLPLPMLAGRTPQELRLLRQMLTRGLNSPPTSSCGRLFDAAAALIGVRAAVSYEGQAAMELEALAERGAPGAHFPYGLESEDGRMVLDFRPLFAAMVTEVMAGAGRETLARRFHDTLAQATAAVCAQIGAVCHVRRVVLSGGVFQNRLLAEGVHAELSRRGFTVFSHRLVPPNDGGLALGQAVITGRSQVCV